MLERTTVGSFLLWLSSPEYRIWDPLGEGTEGTRTLQRKMDIIDYLRKEQEYFHDNLLFYFPLFFFKYKALIVNNSWASRSPCFLVLLTSCVVAAPCTDSVHSLSSWVVLSCSAGVFSGLGFSTEC